MCPRAICRPFMTSPARTSVEASLPSSTRQAIQTVSLASRPPGWEWPAAIGLIAAFLAFNLATYNMYPEVWCDELWFSEPALNLIHYGSFTTMVYQFQDPGTFPALNCPLYLMAVAPWLKLAGTTVLAVRSFNYTL